MISRRIDSDGHIDRYTLNDVSKKLSYDRLGNLSLLGDVGTPANDQTYRYDALNRLTDFDFDSAGIHQHYDYDAGGNRTLKTVNTTTTTAYLPETGSNRLDSVNGNVYHYDDAGNLTDIGLLSFGYNSRNRLNKVTLADGTVYNYATNALGEQVRKTGDALSTGGRVYVYDEAGHLIGEYDTDGARIQEHIWLGDQPVAVIGSGGSVYYVLSDHLNTPRQIINADNQLRWRWDNLDPFGVNLPDTNPQGLGNFTYALRFPGQYYDSESGLFYNYFRTYDPKGGRYTQSDPIGLMGGLNTYSYVEGNPVNYTDPTGECPWCLAAWAVYEIGASIYDAYDTANTILDPCASASDKAIAGGLFIVGAVLPGGGYSKADDAGAAFFRGAKTGETPNFTPRPNDFKTDSSTGLVKDTHGVSVFNNPESIRLKGFEPHQIDQRTIPDSLQVIQRGKDPNHFEITPKPGANLTPQEYTNACGKIRCK